MCVCVCVCVTKASVRSCVFIGKMKHDFMCWCWCVWGEGIGGVGLIPVCMGVGGVGLIPVCMGECVCGGGGGGRSHWGQVCSQQCLVSAAGSERASQGESSEL